MEIQPVNFYITSYLTNTMYLAQMVVEQYLGQSVLRNDPTRMIFADASNSLRQRMRLHKENGGSDLESLNLPFISYWNPGNWIPDTRLGMLNAKAALEGFPLDELGQDVVKFLQVKATFNCMAYYSNYLDAQVAYETLLWLDKPAEQQFALPGAEYKGHVLDIPIGFSIENLEFNPEMKQQEYFTSKKIIPIKFDVVIKSISFSQKPQPEGSLIFDKEVPVVLTKQVMLDFLTYKYSNQYFDKQNIVLTVQQALSPSTNITPVLTVGQITDTTITVSWYIDPNATSLVNDAIRLNLNSVTNIDVSKTLGAYTFTGLTPESVYNITMWVYDNTGRVSSALAVATTSAQAPIFLKGIKGF